MQSKFGSYLKVSLTVIVAIAFLSGCKATATLSINVEDGASGNMALELEFDESAAQIVRSQAYNPQSFQEVFSLEAFENSGFEVTVEEEPIKIIIAADFENEQDLQNALAAFASEDVVDATLNVTNNPIFEETDLKLDIDLTRLRADYLESEEVRQKVIDAGIEFEDFETLINDAFSSTRVNIELSARAETIKTAIITQEQEKKLAEVSSSKVRTNFLLNISGAILSLIAAAFVLWRIRRRSSVVSYIDQGRDKGPLN